MKAPLTAPERERLLQRYRTLVRLFDEALRIPGTRLRFGLDALIGLFPGAGDVIGAGFALYGIVLARRLGAPAAIQIRMLANVALDALGGALPIAGDIFDVAFKAHVRNRALLERWHAAPEQTRRLSRAAIAAVVLLTAGAVAAMVAVLVLTARWIDRLAM